MIIALAILTSGTALSEETFKWLDFAEAFPKARAEGKHLIINFYSIGCGWCRKMDGSTYGDSAVAAIIAKDFVAARMNVASNRKVDWMGEQVSEREIASALAGRGTPFTTFIDTAGVVVARLPGYVDSPRFISILEYVGGYWYENLSYQEYIESGKVIEAQDQQK